MRTIDTETEEYIAPGTVGDKPAPRQRAARKTAAKSARRPTPDPAGPSTRRTPKKRKESTYSFVDFLRDYRTHLAVGILLCLTGIVMTVCGISFLFNSSADQSVIHGRSAAEIVAAGDAVGNAGGPVGAKLAEWMMVDTFGIGSFVLAFYLFMIGLTVIRAYKVDFFSFTFRCLFTAVALSVVIGLVSYNRDNMFHLGGSHGYHMNTLLLDYSGALGAYSVMVFLLGLLVAVYLKPLKRFFGLLGRVMRRKPVQLEVDAESADATEAAVSPLDSFDNADSDEEIVEAAHEASLDLPADEDEEDAGDAEPDPDRSAYMPSPALDAFEASDESEAEDIEPEAAVRTAAMNMPQEQDVIEMPETPLEEVVEVKSDPSDPELIIVQKTPDEVSANEEPAALIRNGDHIGLDQRYDVRASHQHYVFPSTDLLVDRQVEVEVNEAEQQANKKLIVDALLSYNIEIQRIEATIGPTVTLYEIVPAQGTRIAKIKSLEDDIAMSLSALGIRIIAPMPGKGTVGIEVPNRKAQVVPMRNVLESKVFKNTKMALPMALGATISNDIFMADLAKLPHLLVAGATGQGKSVGLNCIITSLLYSKHPDELKFVLVDPKTVEFSLFETISRQYLAKLPDEPKAVITDPQKVVATLNSLCVEMEHRYELLSAARVRVIGDYNEKFMQRRLNPEDGHRFMPYIVVIVDEYADLVMVAGKEVAVPIARITQKARAVGIHMILATQRPSTDVITGMIKNNFTARIAFKVTQGVDSKTILDRPGAQRLIGRGDMLTMMNGVVERVQCAFVDTPEVEAICDHIGSQQGFVSCYELPEPPVEGDSDGGGNADYGAVTEEFKRCALFISSQTQASITMMQRKFEIGFNKAGRFMDQMQQMGIVGPARGAKPRDVLMTPDEVQRLFE